MSLSILQLHQKFETLEVEKRLFENFSTPEIIWEITRHNIYTKLLIENKHIEKELGVNRSIKNLIKIFFKNFTDIIFKNPFLIKKNKTLLLSTGRRIPDNKGLFWDIYIDYFIEELGEDKFEVIENMNFSGLHPKPARTKNLSYSDSFHLLVVLLAKFIALFSSKNHENEWQKIENIINTEFESNINVKQVIRSKIATYKAELLLYKLLFKITKPKAVGVINAPNRKAALVACKLLNIKSFEIQHGTMGKYHIGYYYPSGTQKIHPDYFLFMGEYWKNSINNPVKEENSIMIGHPYLESKLETTRMTPKKRQVLFISQALTTVFEFALSLSKTITSDIEIVVKLHPGEYGNIEQLKATYGNTIKIIGPGTDIYHLLAESKWVFGVYSTVMYEALKFNCICFLINSPGIEYMNELIKMGAATLVNSAAEVNLDFNKDSPKVNADIFFMSDWKQNIKAFENVIS